MSNPTTADRFLWPWLGVVLVTGMLAPGCATRAPAPASTFGATVDRTAADLPSGAIRVGDRLYQIPIGEDDDGCPMFRLYSPTDLVAQAIYYRNVTGGFTMDRQKADCTSPAPD